MAKENISRDDSGNIFGILNIFQQESLVLAPIITLMILFCIVFILYFSIYTPKFVPSLLFKAPESYKSNRYFLFLSHVWYSVHLVT